MLMGFYTWLTSSPHQEPSDRPLMQPEQQLGWLAAPPHTDKQQ